ncbi:MAG: ABC transporter permease [Blastocatellia bacterium]|nr:ABC transporter permease [Blastocatellia bacterium]
MNWTEVFRLAFDAIFANKLRSGLTLLGVIIGIFSVTVVATLLEGANSYVSEKVSSFGAGTLQVVKASFQGFGNFEKFLKAFNQNPDLTREDMEALREQVTLAQAIGATDGSSAPIRYGNTELTGVGIQGVTGNFTQLSMVEPASGRYFTDFDDENRRYVCFLGQDVAKGLFPATDAVGHDIRIGNNVFNVVGVCKPLGTFFGQSQDNFVQIPLGTYLKIFGSRRSLSLFVKPKDKVDPLKVEDQLRVIMRSRHHLKPGQDDDFSIVNDETTQELFTTLTGAVAAVALPITGISLLVGGIVIMNIMLVSVTERTREIGIRKSVGARQRDILAQFLAESALLSGLGGLIGLTSAYTVMRIVSAFSSLPVALPLWAVATSLLVSTAVGLFFGIYPASRAAKLDPIQALRAE